MSSRRMISLFMLRFSAAACSRSRARRWLGMFLMVMEATAYSSNRRMEPFWFHMRLESILVVCGGAPAGGGAREASSPPRPPVAHPVHRRSGRTPQCISSRWQDGSLAGRRCSILHGPCRETRFRSQRRFAGSAETGTGRNAMSSIPQSPSFCFERRMARILLLGTISRFPRILSGSNGIAEEAGIREAPTPGLPGRARTRTHS